MREDGKGSGREGGLRVLPPRREMKVRQYMQREINKNIALGVSNCVTAQQWTGGVQQYDDEEHGK